MNEGCVDDDLGCVVLKRVVGRPRDHQVRNNKMCIKSGQIILVIMMSIQEINPQLYRVYIGSE